MNDQVEVLPVVAALAVEDCRRGRDHGWVAPAPGQPQSKDERQAGELRPRRAEIELMGIAEESEGLKAVVRRRPERVLEVAWGAADVLLNLNTPLDLPPTDVGEILPRL